LRIGLPDQGGSEGSTRLGTPGDDDPLRWNEEGSGSDLMQNGINEDKSLWWGLVEAFNCLRTGTVCVW